MHQTTAFSKWNFPSAWISRGKNKWNSQLNCIFCVFEAWTCSMERVQYLGVGGFSHWLGIRICSCLLGRFFAKFAIAIGGFSSETKEPKLKNWGFFEQIIVKSIQFGQNWVLFYRKRYTDGWVIGQNIGIAKVKFWRFVRHIHVRF